ALQPSLLGPSAQLLLVATAFGVGALAGRAHPVRAAAQPVDRSAQAAVAVPAVRAPLLLLGPLCTVVGLGSRGLLLVWFTPAQEARFASNWSEEQVQYLAWIGDLRQVCAVLVGVGLLLTLARLGVSPLVGAAATAAIMVADLALAVNGVTSGTDA